MLDRGSSPVDCNAIFVLLPPILIWLFTPYGKCFNKGIHVIWLMLIIVGICSAYFHATLSLLGQLLDELAILWVVAAAFALWFPDHYLPLKLRNNRAGFQAIICTLAIISTGLAFLYPAVNAFALMGLGVPAVSLMLNELSRCKNIRVLRLGTRCGAVWCLAVTCWINDRVFCETWSNLNFPYFHAIWHILIFVSSYTACVLFAYFDAQNRIPEQEPELRFWPSDKYEVLGVPYVGLGSGNPSDESSSLLGGSHSHKLHLI